MGKSKSKHKKKKSKKRYLSKYKRIKEENPASRGNKNHSSKTSHKRMKRKHSSSSSSSSSSSCNEYAPQFATSTNELSTLPSSSDNNYKQSTIQKKELSIDDGKGFSIKSSTKNDSISQCDENFNWKNYMWQLNKMFFSSTDFIQEGSEEYKEFWSFLAKYEQMNKVSLLKQKESAMGANNNPIGSSTDHNHHKRCSINFTWADKNSITNILDRLPPTDTENRKQKRLSLERIEEFRFILLLYVDFIQKKKFSMIKSLRQSQKNLPIAQYKCDILNAVESNRIVILAGDTGCGKSTQLPQYLLSEGYINIACTQPRRIACVSLSKRVAHETLNEYGSKIGFQIRFDRHVTKHTKILFLTEGLLLRQIATNPMLSQYNVIILDEIHERHLQTDFLLGVIKCLAVQRPDIKVILMSATINLDLFSNYFMGKAPVIQIPGRLFPIELKYFPISIVEKGNQNEKLDPAPYIRILQLIDKNYPSNERGDVLMFMSGMKEITTVIDAATLYSKQTGKWIVLSLHSSLSLSEQEKVFDYAPEGVRKCIVSTNIAETSVTIDGIRFVIDSGKVKEMSYDPIHKMQKLKEFWVSQASAEQRKGRAGRTGPGVCFRLYSEKDYQSFVRFTTPEILRVPIDSLVLQMISMGLPRIEIFPFIEPPDSKVVQSCLRSLKTSGALTSDQEITPMGRILSQLPLDVSLGKMLIMGTIFQKMGPILSMAAVLSVQSPYTNRAHRDPDCFNLNQDLLSDHGDPFTLLNTYREWLRVRIENGRVEGVRWCRKRGLEEQRFFDITKLRQQFQHMLVQAGLTSVCERSLVASSSERSRRVGELRQLKRMRQDLHEQGPRKPKLLRLSSEGSAVFGGEEDDSTSDRASQIKDIDFKIRYDNAKLNELYRESSYNSFKDLILLKLILAGGIFPQISIPDEHNSFKQGSDQYFHTPFKDFVSLQPNSVFSVHPDVLQLTDADILPGHPERHPFSNNHQGLCYVSILDTDKPFLVNSFRVPLAQTLLLFSPSIDTNSDFSWIVFDNFIELKFADCFSSQHLVSEVVYLRKRWKELVDSTIKLMDPSSEVKSAPSSAVVDNFTKDLLRFCQMETFYSAKRLLNADVKVLHRGPGPEEVVSSLNPFSERQEPCLPNTIKGGYRLTDYLNYNSILDLNSERSVNAFYQNTCQFCQEEINLCTIDHIHHLLSCKVKLSPSSRVPEDGCSEEHGNEGFSVNANSASNPYFCDKCDKVLNLSNRDILRHIKTHL